MSEYQYHEFQALDRTLSKADRSYLQGLSSRAELTATNARFVYNYGDFRGDPLEVLDRCFDSMLYIANFGVRRLTFRLPKELVDPAQFEPYSMSYCITVKTSERSTIIDIDLSAEDYFDWIEGEGWLASLAELRDDLLQGDLRLLYLAWLRAGSTDNAADTPENLFEPLVPSGLKQLSPALEAFAEMFAIDRDLITAAATASPASKPSAEPIEEWIAALPKDECDRFLVRVAKGETHVGASLMQRLRELSAQPVSSKRKQKQRSLAELMEIALGKHQQREQKEQKVAEAAKRRRLEALAPKSENLWQEIYRLIEFKQAKPYDEAVAHLQELRDLAEYQDSLESFLSRIEQIQRQYSNRPGLLTRLRNAQLLRK